MCIRDRDVAVLISMSGNTKEVLEMLALSRQCGTPTVALTKFDKSVLAQKDVYKRQIYMSGMSEQMARHFENIIELRFEQVEGIVSAVPSKSADKEAMYADLVYRAQVRGFEYLALCTSDGRFEMCIRDRL